MEQKKLGCSRLTTAYYRAGEHNPEKLLLLHGNVSSSAFYLPLIPALAKRFDVVAPDLRCFGGSDALPVDATRGLRDWSDDIDEFVTALGWDSFAFAGWSMGGGVAMQYAIDHGEKLTGLILISPLSPYGFGGTKGETGEKLEPVGLASGGGCVNPQLIDAIAHNKRDFLLQTLNGLYFAPPFRMEAWEERFLDAMASTKVGEGMYPGDGAPCGVWPNVVSGAHGVNNTMSPAYCDLSPLADIPAKPPVLWLRGDRDLIVSDGSMCDFPFLGKLGAVPGWPGDEVCPPQPMLAQTRHVLDRYAKNGGKYTEKVFEGAGHGCHLEQPESFINAVFALLD